MSKLYFHGHRLDKVLACDFFYRYGLAVDWGFCGGVSALMMLALRNNRTARIVRGNWKNEKQGTVFHSWVEFRYCGVWFVCDPCWRTDSGIRFRHSYLHSSEVEITYCCQYDEFWSYPISAEFYDRLQNPATSHLLYELFCAYTWAEGSSEPFHYQISTLHLEAKNGTLVSRGFIEDPYYDRIIFSRRVVNEFIANPKRKQIKAHTRRCYCAYRKKVQAHLM